MSFFFYDYETTGIDPKRDRILQFAGIRTDNDLNIIGDPVCHYCKLSPEIIPHPEALLITAIDPYTLNTKGLNEPNFIEIIHQEFAPPDTCVVGYNNIRFDDEFTRYAFYRNFYDPYAREWQNNNSRWDLIDVVRMCAALRPDGINWPYSLETNKITFKLEELTKANNLEHSKSHDALSDVYATISIAKLIKTKQLKLFNYLLNTRRKEFVKNMLNGEQVDIKSKIIVHSTRMINNDYYGTSVFLPLMQNPNNANEIIAWDLRYNPEILFNLQSDIDYAKKLLYSKKEDLAPNEDRLHIKSIHCNKSPAVAPFNTLDNLAYDRLQLNPDAIIHNSQMIIKHKNQWDEIITKLYSEKPDFYNEDVEHDLYNKFISNSDKVLSNQLLSDLNKDKDPKSLKEFMLKFSDQRLKELLFRYRARNYPDTLDKNEADIWQKYCLSRLNNINNIAGISKQDFIAECNEIVNAAQTTEKQKQLMISWMNLYDQ